MNAVCQRPTICATNRTIHLRQHKHQHDRKSDGQLEKKKNEITMISQAYAIVHKRTVMIHFQYAASANLAVVASRWLGTRTLGTPLQLPIGP
mmetsp:Transcript_44704/g.83378  ORF Transcript_44704/g.83378 Transcript_44704/m.83378 type:complete len:92 (+) Transcript_44704:512-787(+)